MSREEFEILVKEGIKAIPKDFLDKLDNVSITIEDFPTPYQAQKMRLRHRWQLFGLYEGIPLTQRRSSSYFGVLPDKITIFQKPIEAFSSSPETIKELVMETVWHEIAHHFGMDEDQVRAAERRRKLGARRI